MGRMATVLALACSLTGCVTAHLQESIQTAIRLEARCRAVEEAVPAEQANTLRHIRNAVFLRLTGTCHDAHGAECLGAGAETSVASLFKTSEVLAVSLSRQVRNLQQARDDQRVMLENIARIEGRLQSTLTKYLSKGGLLRRDLDALRAALEFEAATTEVSSLAKCTERTKCMQDLAAWLVKRQAEVAKAMVQLKAHADEGAAVLQGEAAALTSAVQRLQANVDESSADAKATMDAMRGLALSAAQLSEIARRVALHARVGVESIQVLNASDLAEATKLFMADKLWPRVAERTLAFIDSSVLQPVERAAEKLDEQLFLAATVATTIYSAEIQKSFDAVYVQTVVPRFTSRAGRLAFANAACQHLQAPPPPGQHRPPLLRPFVLAMLTNVETEIKNEGVRVEASPAYEAAVAATRERPVNDHEFAAKLQAALSSEVEKGATLSLTQQVALCANTEVALRAAQPGAQRTAALDDCGRVTFAVNASAQPISPGVVMTAAAEAPTRTEEAKPLQEHKWPRPPAIPSRMEALCGTIGAHVAQVQCFASRDKAVIVPQAYFAPNAASDTKVDTAVAALAEQLALLSPPMRVRVEGFSSSGTRLCRTNVKELKCGRAWNAELALARANRAQAIFTKRSAAPAAFISSFGHGDRAALEADSALDRRLRIILTEPDASDVQEPAR